MFTSSKSTNVLGAQARQQQLVQRSFQNRKHWLLAAELKPAAALFV
jgi:hypothetical protein